MWAELDDDIVQLNPVQVAQNVFKKNIVFNNRSRIRIIASGLIPGYDSSILGGFVDGLSNRGLVTSTERRKLCFHPCWFVCLFVCEHNYGQNAYTDFQEIFSIGRA